MKEIVGDLIAEQSIADTFVDGLSEREWNETIRSDLRVYDIEGIWKIRDVVSHLPSSTKRRLSLHWEMQKKYVTSPEEEWMSI